MTVSLDDLFAELKKGRIYECALRDTEQKHQVQGLQSGKDIWIDPRCAVLEIVVHEVLHRVKPSWKESTVTMRARNFVVDMDEQTKSTWWRAYNRIKIKRRSKYFRA